MLVEFSKRGAKEKVVVIDEKWIFFTDVGTKEGDRAWVSSAGDTPIPIQARSSYYFSLQLFKIFCIL